jgi:hypothetical protein
VYKNIHNYFSYIGFFLRNKNNKYNIKVFDFRKTLSGTVFALNYGNLFLLGFMGIKLCAFETIQDFHWEN